MGSVEDGLGNEAAGLALKAGGGVGLVCGARQHKLPPSNEQRAGSV